MKRVSLLFAFALGLSVAGAFAEAPAPAVVDPTAFLEQLGAAPTAPQADFLSGCYISRECVCGGGYVTIECWGEVSCSYGPRSVICDGHSTSCPPIGSCPP
jgi:hypothetical protein